MTSWCGSISNRKTSSMKFELRQINGNVIYLRLFSIDQDGSVLEFVDANGINVDIPDGISVVRLVYDAQIDFQTVVNQRRRTTHTLPIPVAPFRNCFIFFWINSYHVKYNNRIIIRLDKQKQHAIAISTDEQLFRKITDEGLQNNAARLPTVQVTVETANVESDNDSDDEDADPMIVDNTNGDR